jgi:hypothetical protein
LRSRGLLTVAVWSTLQVARAQVAADLRPGMQLIYAADGRDQAPWEIDAVDAGLPLKGDADCARVRLRRQPGRAPTEDRLCVENGTLYSWDATQSAWLPQRPVGPRMNLVLDRPNGETVRYETSEAAEEIVGPLRLRVIATTVTTMDATGKARRRLRERYAVGLATATGGIFEVPDPGAATGWRTEQAFELREIRFAQ